MYSKQLKEERSAISKEMEKLVLSAQSTSRPLSKEERDNFDKYEKQCSELTEKIEGYERMERFQAQRIQQEQVNVGNQMTQTLRSITDIKADDADRGLRGWLFSKGMVDKDCARIANEYKGSAERCGFTYDKQCVFLQFASQSSITANLGSEFVPTLLADEIYRYLYYPSNIRNVSKVVRTETGGPFTLPISTDVTNIAVKIAQSGSDAVQAIPTDKKQISSIAYTSKQLAVPFEWSRDSKFPVWDFISESLGSRLDRGTSKALCLGGGPSAGGGPEPGGYAVGATQAVSKAHGTPAVKMADMLALLYSVPLPYRESPDFCFRVSDYVHQQLQQEVDGDGRSMWMPFLTGAAAGAPLTYLGKRIYIDPWLQDLSTAANISAVAGDFSTFLIREVGGIEMWTLPIIATREISVVMFTFLDSVVRYPLALQSLYAT